MQVEIRREREADRDAIRRVLNDAFEGEDEANLVDGLRAGNHVALSLVAESEGNVVGHILFSHLQVRRGQDAWRGLSLAPMAVHADCQRLGIGQRLVREGLEQCQADGYPFVLVLGHPEYYPRFGFSSQLAERIESPFGGGPAWMALELKPDALADVSGVAEFASPFSAFE